ncbi:N-formylglutamate amidohydrolase [Rubripirellula amarantea]|uniref:N-formylglutamate amidohydrolase n=1 Tax=Rubripirellula amarantea TaxID=2527999 RepID=A0A5C5WDK7_9BACT|nr:N-formylglutamate amidohydrolase [Rubripirellula amarantea]TWT48115.1 N-formylglutamate amidohydrolase [Rubripirellula amarantea]
MCLLITCEGGGNAVPASLQQGLRATSQSGKRTRRPSMPADLQGDSAARWAAERLSKQLGAPLIANEFSPHLVDVRRSLHHRSLFSTPCRQWSVEDRDVLLTEIYHPYREMVERKIDSMLNRYTYMVHLSIRSFAFRGPKGKPRRTDVGLLYDPSRNDEVDLCLDWIDEMYDQAPMLKVRRNYPGRGINDSLTKSMRGIFNSRPYLGIDVWLNRAWSSRHVQLRDEALDGLASSLRSLVLESNVESDSAAA